MEQAPQQSRQNKTLEFEGDVVLLEGQAHNDLFITGVGNVERTMRSSPIGKVMDMRLINGGSLVQVTLKNPKDPKNPVVSLVHIVNFTSVTVK